MIAGDASHRDRAGEVPEEQREFSETAGASEPPPSPDSETVESFPDLTAELQEEAPAAVLRTPPVQEGVGALEDRSSRLEDRRTEDHRELSERLDRVERELARLVASSPYTIGDEVSEITAPITAKLEGIEQLLRTRLLPMGESVALLLDAVDALRNSQEHHLNPLTSWMGRLTREEETTQQLKRVQNELRVLQEHYRALQDQHSLLQKERDRINVEYRALQGQHAQVQKETESYKAQYQRALAASAPRSGAVEVFNARPSPDLIYSRLETLEHGNWRSMIEAICRCKGAQVSGAQVSFELRAYVSYRMVYQLFNAGRPRWQQNVDALELEFREHAKLQLDRSAKEGLGALAVEVCSILADIGCSQPSSTLILPEEAEWLGLPYDQSRFKAHTKSDEGSGVRVRYLIYPGYRTNQRVLLQPHVYATYPSPTRS